MSKPGNSVMKPVPFHHLFSFRVSVQYTGVIFDGGGDRIVQVDVDHNTINILQREQVKKAISIRDIESLYAPKRQAMQLVIVESESKLQNTLWFMNQGELDLFHAVVQDLKDGRHPGNRITVPLIRQATIMKRNRAGFFNIRHATLMPGKMVLARSKGNSPPDDVVVLRDAALGLDEKKGLVTIGVAGRTSVWKGLNSEDTFKWHDALLSALSGPSPVRKTQAQKRNGKPARLSMIFGDELATDRVYKARESMFMDASGMGSDGFEPPDISESESPLPDATMMNQQNTAAEDLMPSPHSQQSDDTPPALRGMVKAVIGQMRENLKKTKDRERALSTVTQLPDDIAWRDADELDSTDNASNLSDSPVAHHQRWSADEAPKHQVAAKGHHRTGSAPPNVPMGASIKGNHENLQKIPEDSHIATSGGGSETPNAVHFPDQDHGRALLLTTVLEAPDTPSDSPRHDSSVMLHGPAKDIWNTGTGQPVADSVLPKKPISEAPTPVTISTQHISQSTHSDTVELPPTPERHIPPAHSSSTSLPEPAVIQAASDEALQAYAPVQWPDVHDVRQLNTMFPLGRVGVPPSHSVRRQPDLHSDGVSPAAVNAPPHYHSFADGPHSCHADRAWQHSRVAHTAGRNSQQDTSLLDGTFLPGAPRAVSTACDANNPHQWLQIPPHSAVDSLPAVAVDPDASVLRSLGKAWLNRSRLRGMVRQLKGSLVHGPAQSVNSTDIVSKLDHIDQMLDDLPEMEEHTTKVEDEQRLVMFAEASEPNLASQDQIANNVKSKSSAIQEHLHASSDEPLSAAPHLHSNTMLTRPADKDIGNAKQPQIDAIARQMDVHSAELLHHISVAMSQLPSASAFTDNKKGSQSLQLAERKEVGGAVMPERQSSTAVRSHGYIQNPLFVNSAATSKPASNLEPSTSPFSDLISRIRLTEDRLQEAITSLTDATHRFKEEIPHEAVRRPTYQQLKEQDAMAGEHERSQVSALSQLCSRAGHSGRHSNGNVASPLQSLEWTQLSPLYPASSRSMSPESQITSQTATQRHSPMPQEGSRTEHSTARHLNCLLSEKFDPVTTSCNGNTEGVNTINKRQPCGHRNSGAHLSLHRAQKPTDQMPRQSAMDSMISISSAWSLEQSGQDTSRILSEQPTINNQGIMAETVQSCGIRAMYSAPIGLSGHHEKHSTCEGRKARPVAASAGHVVFEPHKGIEDADSERLQPSASLPGWSSAAPDSTPWLEERNSHRVSYYEPTIFTLRQAGIHVEPHWFGPIMTCAADVDSGTRTATDNICRAARSIVQTATDLESYFLKRFPLSPEPKYTAWVDDENESGRFDAAIHLQGGSVGCSANRINRNGHSNQSLPRSQAGPEEFRDTEGPLFAAAAHSSSPAVYRGKGVSALQAALERESLMHEGITPKEVCTHNFIATICCN
eukprot:jgi/Ulvmu1/5751/UM025_0005.1